MSVNNDRPMDTTFLRLPKDVYTVIESFDHFGKSSSALARTCKELNQIICNIYIARLQRKESLTSWDVNNSKKILGGKIYDWDPIFKHCLKLQELQIEATYFVLDPKNKSEKELSGGRKISLIMQSAINHCDLLTKLSFVLVTIDTRALSFLGRKFENLSHLNLSTCTIEIPELLNTTFEKLTHLHLINCWYSPGVIEKLFKCSSNLTSIKLLDDKAIVDTIHHIAENCPKLGELIIVPPRGVPRSFFGDQSIIHLAEKCPLLTTLEIPKSLITEKCFGALAEHCKGLTSLHLELHCWLTSVHPEVPDYCEGVITNKGLAALRRQLPDLKIT